MHRLERAIALHRRHERAADLPAVREAVDLLRDVVADEALDVHHRAAGAASLGLVLRDLGIAEGDHRVQDEAVHWLRVAREHVHADHRPTVEHNLAVVLRDRYFRRNALPDLVESVALLNAVIRRATPTQQAQALDNLGLALRMQHRREGDLAHLEEAVRVHRQAVDVAPHGDPERPRYLNDLASALRAVWEYRPTDELLDEAIALHEQALRALPPTAPFRQVCLHDLFTTLLPRNDLHRLLAVDRELRALFAARGQTPDAAELNRRVVLLLRLAGAGATIDVAADLAEAVTLLHRAIDQVAEGIPERAQLRANLADCLRLQHGRRPGEVAADVVTATYRRACQEGLQAGADSAVVAALHWAAWAERRPQPAWPEAAEAYGYALTALYRMVALQLGDARRRVRLGQLRDVPARAALAHLRAGSAEPDDGWAATAVTELERGRALALSAAIDLDGARLAALAGGEHDALVDRFRSAVAELRRREAAPGS